MLVPSKMLTRRNGREEYRLSKFNASAEISSETLLLVNTLRGSTVMLSGAERDAWLAAPLETSLTLASIREAGLEDLIAAGFIIPTSANELRQARYAQAHHTSRADHLHLIIFPTEQCNFRCVYCYEDFAIGEMPTETQRRLTAYLEQKIPSLRSLQLHWFGGEPLLAPDVISAIGGRVVDLTRQYGCKLTSHITTNGYLLDAPHIEMLFAAGVRSFQITLDGPPIEHNQRRRLHRDLLQGTYEQIENNICSLLARAELFSLTIRVNYDRDSISAIPNFIDYLAELFGRDPRIFIDFAPIWADPNEVPVSLCLGKERQRSLVGFLSYAHDAGLKTSSEHCYEPGAQVCYAAKANSFVVRANGRINKCTVALNSDFNDVGELTENGGIVLDLDRIAKWTGSGMEEDTTCQTCWNSPACQGNACPLERFENNKRPCPTAKTYSDETMRLSVRL